MTAYVQTFCEILFVTTCVTCFNETFDFGRAWFQIVTGHRGLACGNLYRDHGKMSTNFRGNQKNLSNLL